MAKHSRKKRRRHNPIELEPRVEQYVMEFHRLLEKVVDLGSRLGTHLKPPLRGVVDDIWERCEHAAEDIDELLNED